MLRIEVEQTLRRSDHAALDRRPRQEDRPRCAVIGARRAVLLHGPAELTEHEH